MNWSALSALNSSLILNKLETLPDALEEKAYEREAVAEYTKYVSDLKENIWSCQHQLDEKLPDLIAQNLRDASSNNTIENFELICNRITQDKI